MNLNWSLLYCLLLPVCFVSCSSQDLSAQGRDGRDRDTSLKYANRAQTAMEQGKYDYALSLCDSAMQLDGNNAHGLWVRSVVHIKQGHYPEAFAALDRATDLDPQGHLAYRAWIKLNYFRDTEGAIADYDRIIAMDSASGVERWDPILGRAIAYFEAGNHATAIRDIKHYTTKTGEEWALPEAFLWLARAYSVTGDSKSALMACERGYLVNEKYPELWFTQGEVYQSIGKNKEACDCWKQALGHARSGYIEYWPYGRKLYQLNESDISAALRQHCP